MRCDRVAAEKVEVAADRSRFCSSKRERRKRKIAIKHICINSKEIGSRTTTNGTQNNEKKVQKNPLARARVEENKNSNFTIAYISISNPALARAK